MRTGGRPYKDEPPRPTRLGRVSADTHEKLRRLARQWDVPFAVAFDRVALAVIDRVLSRDAARTK